MQVSRDGRAGPSSGYYTEPGANRFRAWYDHRYGTARPAPGGHDIASNLDKLRIDRNARSRRGTGARIWLFVGLTVILLAVVLGTVWIGTDRPVEVRVATVTERAGDPGSATVLNASGYVTARRQATVSSKITGKLVEVNVEEGDKVTSGQVLARLDDSQYVAALRLAESQLAAARKTIDETRARLDLARATLRRTERLFGEEVVGEAELDAARAEVAALEARVAYDGERIQVGERDVALRRTQLDDTVIRAPFDGIAISKDAQAGEMVSPVSAGGGFTRTGICTLVDMASLEIEVDVNEAYISRVRPGQPVEAVLDAYPDWKIPARVITTIPAADRQKATFLVRVGFVELDPRILPDMGIKVAFQEEIEASDALRTRRIVLVPRAALKNDQGRDVVFVVEDDLVERRAVTLARDPSADPAEVVAGLAPGDRVVVDPPAELNDGDRIRQ
jgi:RND family efflux transporter MFP subunit